LACGEPGASGKSPAMLPQVVVALHVFAVILWIGSIASAGWLLANRGSAPTPEQGKAAVELALGLYRRVAAPAFVMAFSAGLIRVLMDRDAYLKAHWFHGKLTLALVVIALHHILGARAARLSKALKGAETPQVGPQTGQGTNREGILTGALVLCALGVVVLVVLKSSLVP
jgi:putative membrane protein